MKRNITTLTPEMIVEKWPSKSSPNLPSQN